MPKLTFAILFLFQVNANYFVIKKYWIDERDIIEEIPIISITSCHMQCANTEECTGIGFINDPDLLDNSHCVLLKGKRAECKKEGSETKLLFVLVDVSFYFIIFFFLLFILI